VTVRNANGEILAESEIKEQRVVDGSFWTGAKGAMEKGVPSNYDDVIRAVVRDNPKITAALSS